jgi:hypothetical protein
MGSPGGCLGGHGVVESGGQGFHYGGAAMAMAETRASGGGECSHARGFLPLL